VHDGVVILGAGVAGLGAGLELDELGAPFEVLERDDDPGGLTRTDVVDGFSFERTGHVLHFRLPHVEERFRATGVPLERIERRAAILLRDREVPYPFQYNLWALGSRRLARSVVADMRHAPPDGDGADSFAEHLLSLWGAAAMELFFRPYNEKLWGRRLEELPADCAGRFLPKADLALAARGAEGSVDHAGYNGSFLYPASGRLGDIAAALAEPIADHIRAGVTVTGIDLPGRRLRTANGAEIPYSTLVSTIPLAELARLAGLPAARGLFDATAILNVRVGLRGRLRTPYHWVYVADPELPFHRVGFPRNISPRTCPDGCTSLSVEYTPPRRGPRLTAAEVATAAVAHLVARGLLEVDGLVVQDELLISPAYVVRRSPGREPFAELTQTLAARGVLLAGRFGAWDYLSVEESFESGVRAARACLATVM
jgi:protoporphyrinogen oxidase